MGVRGFHERMSDEGQRCDCQARLEMDLLQHGRMELGVTEFVLLETSKFGIAVARCTARYKVGEKLG